VSWVKVWQPCIMFCLSVLNIVLSQDAPLNPWEETDSLGELCLSVCLSVSLSKSHTHAHSHAHTYTHAKCWVTICECCINWPVLSWQDEHTKCPICSLMAQVRWIRSSMPPPAPSPYFLFFFLHLFPLPPSPLMYSVPFFFNQFNSCQLVPSFSVSSSHYSRACTSCHYPAGSHSHR